jgi:transcription elongation GreA/GreB family factor
MAKPKLPAIETVWPKRDASCAIGASVAPARMSYVPRRNAVQFGNTVTIVRDDGREQTFRIVGEDEADPKNGSISQVSPLARSLFNKRVGDTIKAGNGEAEILAIK